MAILLNSYIQNAEFETIVDHIHESVCSNDLVKHYFVLAKKSVVLQDMRRYWSYLTPKTALDYRRPASPSASVDIQLPDSQFAEIIQVMARVFRHWKVNPEHVPQLTHEILELMEESRSQTNDTIPSRLAAGEVSSDKLQYFLKRYKISTEVMPSKAIMAERGLSHKLWLQIDAEKKHIVIEGRILISDNAYQDQVEDIIEKQNNKESFVKLQLDEDSGRRRLIDRHKLSYAHGIPMRLFVRYLRRFSTELDQIHTSDQEGILQPG